MTRCFTSLILIHCVRGRGVVDGVDVDDGTLRRGGTDLEMAEGGEMNSDAIIDAMRAPGGGWVY